MFVVLVLVICFLIAYSSYFLQVLIEGTSGGPPASDMAVDDLKLRFGDCSSNLDTTLPPPTEPTTTKPLTTTPMPPTTTTQPPTTTTQPPTTTTQPPTTTNQPPTTTTQPPTTTTQPPTTTTQPPTTTTQPPTTTTQPSTTTQAPTTATQSSTMSSQPSQSTTNSPTPTPEQPNAKLLDFCDFDQDSCGWKSWNFYRKQGTPSTIPDGDHTSGKGMSTK